jgi:hypothetical protein
VLKPTRDRIANQVVETDGELKGEKLSETELNSAIHFTRNAIGDDDSVLRTDAWNSHKPVAFTVHDSDSETGRKIATDHLGEGANATVTAQLVALASITSPSLRPDRHAPVRPSNPHVVLDGYTWRRAGETVARIYKSLPWAPRVSFSYRNSKNTPGIQLADLVAYARRQHLKDGDCTAASAVIDEMRL